MFEPLTQRRYLIPFRAARLPQQVADVLVIGGGVAGLRAAIAAAEAGADVLLLTKDTVEQSNTWYAQGGIAAGLSRSIRWNRTCATPRSSASVFVTKRPSGWLSKKGPSACSSCSTGASDSTNRRAIR